jgi:small subunit ribosomal protein S16
MLKIKLKQNGKIHQRSFRIIVAPDRSKVNGNFVDDLGFYTPQTKTLQIDKEKLAKWIKNGAQVTEGLDKLLNPDKHPRKKKNKKGEEVIEKKEEKVVEKPAETKTKEIPTEEKTEVIETK